MKRIIYFFLIFNFNFCFSQFGIINDLDGYVNVRSSAEKRNNISDKLENGFIVYYFEPEGNWVNIDYKKNGKELNGFIYKDRIKYITDFTNVPLKSNLNGKVKLENENVKIEISETKFIKEKHKLKFYKNEKTQLEKIDNSQIFGTDGNIPKREYKSIQIEINNVKIELPNIALKNLYEPSLYNSKASYDEKNDILYILSSNSDGAGSYEIIWIIEKKKYKNRIEAYGF
ncbi:hypothetical protein AAIP31_002318 [Flavobacterium psychrophilum]|uniref:SH3b domain-containing protein n=1 Tax=Flavobacterium psychrophilum TaxID=96345 RepID=A0A7U2NGW7_FLAPS|nr:hypothetical protein [Flavobacterium psychrophilum]EKT4502339.1 hypothetical protein [Flavobacterium psychrophilum]OAE90490.1 hypothetical protein SU65_12190 [Flavobacterium psychrophilum]QRE04882.1 hypothetical protein H0H26_04645 [Flavobacterium psychrophilum]SNB33729.1 conserved hypothetical protein [Flavobacterium psychrophilum]